jgi:hypothetical protein
MGLALQMLTKLPKRSTELSQRKKFKWLKITQKMLTIPGHKGNANQNHTKIPPHCY